jgi:2-polyprenyl-3-methyl-5-hydroxy-6-metoxy-1,4-benzoquinol methylase
MSRSLDADRAGGGYALGHSDEEIERLSTQARLIDPITRRFFREAGLEHGMRVLDVGCGAGDTSALLLQMVGDKGEVVGVDRAPAAIAAAKRKIGDRADLHFLEGDPAAMNFDQPFDAVVGRFVLMFQSEPASMLKAVARHVRPGGLIAFHELDYEGISSFPPLPTFEQVRRWNAETTSRYGADPRMGAKLLATFVGAGLPVPTVRVESLCGKGPASADLLLLAHNLTRSLLPEMERQGVASRAEVGLETLLQRMQAEADGANGIVVGHLQFGAWARSPGAS